MEIKELEQLLNIIKHSDVSEFELDRDGVHLKITRGPRINVTSAHPLGHSGSAVVEQAILGVGQTQASIPNGLPQAVAAPAMNPNFVKVESPIVGTFYRKPSPDAESFVKEGDRVKKGDTLCIIEAMKMMNEIESPCAGKIEKIILTDGKVVEYGEILFLIDPAV